MTQAEISKAQSRKKVLFVITKATAGGAQRYVYDLATSLPDTFEPVVAYGERGRLAEKLQEAGVRTIEVPFLGRDVSILDDVRALFALLRIVRSERPALVHLHSSKAAALGALAARLTATPSICTVHGWPFKERRSSLARAAIRAASWATALLSTRTVVASRSDKKLADMMPLIGAKTSCIDTGMRAPVFLDRNEARRALDIPDDAFAIGSIAELTPNKGIRYAIEATALLKKSGMSDIRYIVIGDGEERRALEELARERGVSDIVSFRGFVEHAASVLKAFDLYLLPSIKEGMPYVILEAVCAGLPVVATRVLDPEFLSEHREITTVDIGNADALAKSVEQQRTRPQPQTQPPLFPLEKMVNEYARLYDQIAPMNSV